MNEEKLEDQRVSGREPFTGIFVSVLLSLSRERERGKTKSHTDQKKETVHDRTKTHDSTYLFRTKDEGVW